MTAIVDLGAQGPHPDLLASLVESINQTSSQISPQNAYEVRESDIHLLQQRTVYGVTWRNLWERQWRHEGDVIEVDVSVGLAAVSAPQWDRAQVVGFQAHRFPDRDWGIASMTVPWPDDPPKRPWSGLNHLSRGLGIAVGVVSHSVDLGKMRFTLADGQVAECIAVNGCCLMFVPFHSAELWSSDATATLYDAEGREILTETYPLGSMAQVRG